MHCPYERVLLILFLDMEPEKKKSFVLEELGREAFQILPFALSIPSFPFLFQSELSFPSANSQWAQGHAKHFAESQCLVTAYTEGSFLYKKPKENHAIRTPAPSSMAWQTLFLGGESHTDFKSSQKSLL